MGDEQDDHGPYSSLMNENQGYTPLDSVQFGEQGAIFFCAADADADAQNDQDERAYASATNANANAGAFFADMSAFDAIGPDSSDTENDDDNDDAGNALDFHAVADTALRALEEEYSATLRADISHLPELPVAPTDTQTQTQTQTQTTPDDVSLNSQEEAATATPLESDDMNINMNMEWTESAFPPQKELPSIDVDAVRQAVKSIRLKSPDLTATLDNWTPSKPYRVLTRTSTKAQHEHALIPPTPLAAFARSTPKAIRATHNLSRSATLAEALIRLPPPSSGNQSNSNLNSSWIIHLIGCDFVECQSNDTIRTAVGPLLRWIHAMVDPPTHVSIQLLGPNVPDLATKRSLLDLDALLPNASQSKLRTASVTCLQCCYHDYISTLHENGGNGENQPSSSLALPTLVMAFNAGIWGYNEWVPTLEALCRWKHAVPFVVTAYTIEEAEDDAEVMETTILSTNNHIGTTKNKIHDGKELLDRKRLWSAEPNPFASKQERETASAAKGRHYFENGAWQAWILGGE
eukprot:scaffold213799_cov58-Attheya_sp.AAC.1